MKNANPQRNLFNQRLAYFKVRKCLEMLNVGTLTKAIEKFEHLHI